MRRLSEYLGQSYFDYLSSLDDLVILMDEAHRYHADASKKPSTSCVRYWVWR